MIYAICCFLLLNACSNNEEKMQKVDPAGSAAKLNDLSQTKDAYQNIK